MMNMSFELLFLAFTFIWQTSATRSAPAESVTWLASGRSAVVKLDTPGYPLWELDKKNAPSLSEHAWNYYWSRDEPSALLFNITLSHDNKTLLINHQTVVPVPNPNIPSLIQAYQVPGNITNNQLENIISYGVLDREWEGMTLGWRLLDLDYERYITCDPQNKMWAYNNLYPTLKFRVMGIGAHKRDDVLDKWAQPVIHVRLHDTNPEAGPHTSSSSPNLSYEIASIKLDVYNSTLYFMEADNNNAQSVDNCVWYSWRCRDTRMIESGEPYYRYIWRNRFDSYGRIGSLRHTCLKKMAVLAEIFGDAGEAMLLSFVILFTSVMGVLCAVKAVRYYRFRRVAYIRLVAEDDRIVGEPRAEVESDFEEKLYMDEKEEIVLSLPQTPTGHE